MSKWHSFLEYIQFPLKVLFFAIVLLGIGSLMTNPYLEITKLIDSNIVKNIAIILKYIGGFTIRLFPLLVFLKVLTRKYEDSAPVFIGFVSLIIITIVMMSLSIQQFEPYYYTNTLGIEIEMISDNNGIIGLSSPFNTGIFSLILAYMITSHSYRRSRLHVRHGLFYFIDHDTWAVINSVFWSVVCGVALSIVWPWFIYAIQSFFAYISNDIYDVGRMFFYGIFERLSVICNLEEIPRNVFWLSEAGGSSVGANGLPYLGESGLWTAFLMDSSSVLKTGHFTGIYYIINFALIPAFIAAYYKLMGKNRKRYIVFVVVAILFSFLCGISLPIEFLMFILSPLLYILYLLMVGFGYAFVCVIGSLPGYVANTPLFTATPGSILDIIFNIGHASLFYSTISLLIACIVFFVIFYLATILYFKKYAIGFLSMNDVNKIAEETIEAMGGIENVISVDTTPDKMVVSFRSRDIVDLKKLYELGAYLILESKEGYTIRIKNMNIMIGDSIIKIKNEQKG